MVLADKPLQEMTDDELRAEWQKWDNRITAASSWGAALAAATSFRKQCARELVRRAEAINYK